MELLLFCLIIRAMKYILTLLTLLVLCGCGNNSQIEQELYQAGQFMRSAPESALSIIEEIDPEDITRRSTRAKYALLYSQVLDKNYYDIDDDSLIRIAYRYYDKRMCSDSVRFLLNYHYGRIYQNAEDYPSAIRYYLTAEKYALAGKSNYFLGLVYTRIGDVYSEQLNFNGMLEYYMNAYKSLSKLHNRAFQNNALLNIGNAYSSLQDSANALHYYTLALDLAKDRQDNDIISACLSNIGMIYTEEGNISKALQMVEDIQNISPEAVTNLEYILLAKAYYQRHDIDSARYYLNIASRLTTDIRDEAAIKYQSFQIEMAAKNYDVAETAINDYILLSDSISRVVVAQSAIAAEKKFYKEQTAFTSFRLKTRKHFEYATAAFIFILLVFLIYYYRQRIRQKQEQIERYMSLVDSIRLSKDRIVTELEQKTGMEARLKELVLSRFDILDQLGRAFYERANTKAQQEEIFKQVKTFITNLSTDSVTKKEMEGIINTVNDNIIIKLREQFPRIKSSDIDLLSYIYAGFSAQIISVLIDDSVPNIYNRKSRLKARIAASNAPDRELFLEKLT